MNPITRCLAAVAAAVCSCGGAELIAIADWQRIDAHGRVLDAQQALTPPARTSVSLAGARGGYVSVQIVARSQEAGAYRLNIDPFPASSGIECDLYREWFHYVPTTQKHYPDALIPVRFPYSTLLPDPDNRISNQTAQPFWLDIWIPANARPGEYSATVGLQYGSARPARLPIRLTVLRAVVPAKDAITIDHNSYGTSWFTEQYPKLAADRSFFASPAFYELIHSYHRMFYDHRGVFHQLGYGHAGKVGPEFAPALEDSGKKKHIADWTAYDLHYGPLLTGSAFAQSRRGPRPIPFVYLPINPEWPASFLWWGEPGYEREFVNIVAEMERHFREKGWTATRFELFFNQKKRYKGFPWDGDEARFPEDYSYMREYSRLMRAAIPPESPVKFVFRADVSWTMERQFRELAGVVNMWVCSAGMFGWYRDSVPSLKKRGDIVWIYGGTPPVTEPPSHMTTDVVRAWLYGVDGFVRWQTTAPGRDPWFASDGGGETLVYPGERFGISAPIPCLRLKVERNALQDLALLSEHSGVASDLQRATVADRFNNTTVDDWWAPRPAIADTNPEDWTNATVDDAIPHSPKFANIDAAAWNRVHEYVLEAVKGAQ